jgi:hypothetical protein
MGVHRALERGTERGQGNVQISEWRLVQGGLAWRDEIRDGDLLLNRRMLLGNICINPSSLSLLFLHDLPHSESVIPIDVRFNLAEHPLLTNFATVLGDMEGLGVRGGRLEVQ